MKHHNRLKRDTIDDAKLSKDPQMRIRLDTSQPDQLNKVQMPRFDEVQSLHPIIFPLDGVPDKVG